MLSYGEDGPSPSMSSQMESSLVTFSHIIWIILLNHDQFSNGKKLHLPDFVPKIKKDNVWLISHGQGSALIK
jgi:hypothetical protein